MRALTVLGVLVLAAAAACSDAEPSGDSSATSSTTTTEAVSTTTQAPSTTTEPPTTTTEAVVLTCADVTPGVTMTTIESGGNEYGLRLFVPDGLGDGPAPLVLNWHGLGSNGDEQAGFTLHEAHAAQEGYLVASPTGFPSPEQISGNDDRNSWELPQLDAAGRDDIAFAGELIDLLVATSCADERRVYSTGMSNGGLLTSQLVCQLNDRIAAAVSVAGVTRPDECSFSRGVPFLAVHGTEDDVLPYAGEAERSPLLTPDAAPEAFEFFSQVQPDEFAEIAVDMGCDPDPVFAELAEDIRSHEYQNCPDGVPVVFLEVIGAGHTWPGSPFADALAAAGLGTTTFSYDATVDGWAFMSQFSLDPVD